MTWAELEILLLANDVTPEEAEAAVERLCAENQRGNCLRSEDVF